MPDVAAIAGVTPVNIDVVRSNCHRAGRPPAPDVMLHMSAPLSRRPDRLADSPANLLCKLKLVRARRQWAFSSQSVGLQGSGYSCNTAPSADFSGPSQGSKLRHCSTPSRKIG